MKTLIRAYKSKKLQKARVANINAASAANKEFWGNPEARMTTNLSQPVNRMRMTI
jgi:hypothetical protein